MNPYEDIRTARAALATSAQPCGCDRGAHWTCEQHRRDPLDEASYSIQQTVADLYIQIRNANGHSQVTRVWNRLGELESLVSACRDAAGKKANTL